MVEDFDEIGSWPGRGDWHGRAEHTRPARRHHRSAARCAPASPCRNVVTHPFLSRGCDRQFSEAPILYLNREEFRTAALTLGFKPAALRQWRHRRAIPAAAKNRLVYFFNDNFEIIEAPPAVPAGSTLAALATRYIQAVHPESHPARSPGLSAVPGETQPE